MSESQSITHTDVGSLLKAAYRLGGSRLVRIIQMIADDNVLTPMNKARALKYRGVGKKAIGELTQLGVVTTDEVSDPLSGLSTRATNVLRFSGVDNKEQAREMVQSGKLNPWSAYHTVNCGQKTLEEVCRWAGLPVPQEPKRGQICPHCGKNVLELPT